MLKFVIAIGLGLRFLYASTALIWGAARSRTRKIKFENFANQLKLSYLAESEDIENQFAKFTLIAAGHNHVDRNYLTGQTKAGKIKIFDYHYEVGHGENLILRDFSLLSIELKSSEQNLAIWPKSMVSSLPLQPGLVVGEIGNHVYTGDQTICKKIIDLIGLTFPESSKDIAIEATDSKILQFSPIGPISKLCLEKRIDFCCKVRELID